MPAIRFTPLLLAGLVSIAAAQDNKKTLTHADYDNWNRFGGVTLSPDGKYVAYAVFPLDGGDATTIVRNIPTGKDVSVRRGGQKSDGGETPAAGGSPQFSPNSAFVVFPISPTKAEMDKAKAAKTPTDKLPKPMLAVMSLPGGTITAKLPYEKSFTVSGEDGGFLLYHKPAHGETKTETPKTDPKTKAKGKKEEAPAPRPAAGSGSAITLRDLSSGKERTIENVGEHELSKDGKLLAYTVDSKKESENGVFVTPPLDSHDVRALKSGEGRYSRLTWDEKQTKLAFFYDSAGVNADPKVAPPPRPAGTPAGTAPPAPPPKWHVFVWDRGGKSVSEVMTPTTKSLKPGLRLNGTTLGFNADGTRLHLATTVIRPETKPRPESENKVEMDLWHWKDGYIQPMQKLRGETERNRSYSAVLFLDTKQFRQVSDESFAVGLPAVGDWALGSDDKKYLHLTGIVNPVPRDYTLVNVKTSEKKPVLSAVGSAALSPDGRYVLHFDGKDWFTIATADGTKANLTSKLSVKFFNEEDDHPHDPPPYGQAGWTTDGKHVLLYDRFDLWNLAADGSDAVNITKIGRDRDTRFRLVILRDEEDEDVRGIDLTKPLLFASENLKTRDGGYYRVEPGSPAKPLTIAAKRFGTPVKAKHTDTLLLTVQTFSDFPDYFATTPKFTELMRVTDINPQLQEFNRGKAELVHYTSADGVPLSGILIKPNDFDPKKKYPMIVYLYERLSQDVHAFKLPNVTRGQVINAPFYASNGYLVLMPDIAYKTGQPGQSAIKCVLPAIQSVVNQGFVDEKAIGINGQSWGGYQIAYMVTQTNRFKAAVAGAPVANMTSAYGGIRWGTGLPRQFQYEKDQSRIGDTLWRAPMKYLENSPIFMADRVETPLMMIHNDQDDAVPWQQGIEYFLALRRLGKECYLLNYNGEKHNLGNQNNARDFAVRMFQFFEHHLKGRTAPEWMEKGVPFVDRDKEKETIRKELPMPKK